MSGTQTSKAEKNVEKEEKVTQCHEKKTMRETARRDSLLKPVRTEAEQQFLLPSFFAVIIAKELAHGSPWTSGLVHSPWINQISFAPKPTDNHGKTKETAPLESLFHCENGQ